MTLRDKIRELAAAGWVADTNSDPAARIGDAVSDAIGNLNFGDSAVILLRRGRYGIGSLHLKCQPADVDRYGRITWTVDTNA